MEGISKITQIDDFILGDLIKKYSFHTREMLTDYVENNGKIDESRAHKGERKRLNKKARGGSWKKGQKKRRESEAARKKVLN